MSKTKMEKAIKEAEKFTSGGISAVYKIEKLRQAIREEMKNPGVIEAVKEYIFNKEIQVSPLAEVRKANS